MAAGIATAPTTRGQNQAPRLCAAASSPPTPASPCARRRSGSSSADIREDGREHRRCEGRYEFKELPAGRYTLTASKGSYVSSRTDRSAAVRSGQAARGSADGQRIEKVDFSLPRGGIITGRIVDEFGEPVADAQVPRCDSQPGRTPAAAAERGRPAMTNDIGEYRLFGLPPGQYYISATMRCGI